LTNLSPERSYNKKKLAEIFIDEGTITDLETGVLQNEGRATIYQISCKRKHVDMALSLHEAKTNTW
jgi:hypothetical protein